MVRMLGVISLGLFIVFGLGIGAIFIFSSIQFNNLKNQNNSLSTQIASLQTTETQLVLLKDRISKVKVAENLPSALQNMTNFQPIESSLNGNSRMSELDVNSSKITASIVLASNSDLFSFMKTLGSLNKFSNVTLTSFSYNPAVGYLVGLSLSSK